MRFSQFITFASSMLLMSDNTTMAVELSKDSFELSQVDTFSAALIESQVDSDCPNCGNDACKGCNKKK